MLTSFVEHWTVLSTAVSRSGEAVMWRDGPAARATLKATPAPGNAGGHKLESVRFCAAGPSQ